MDEYVCEQCRESVSKTAEVCPHCGYNPKREYQKSARNRWALTMLLFFSVIGAPVAFYTGWKAWGQNKRSQDATPAVPA